MWTNEFATLQTLLVGVGPEVTLTEFVIFFQHV